MHVDERLAHAATFHLEDADRLAAAERLERFLVVKRNLVEIDINAALGEQLDAGRQNRERL